jgi:hypothetical protein
MIATKHTPETDDQAEIYRKYARNLPAIPHDEYSRKFVWMVVFSLLMGFICSGEVRKLCGSFLRVRAAPKNTHAVPDLAYLTSPGEHPRGDPPN